VRAGICALAYAAGTGAWMWPWSADCGCVAWASFRSTAPPSVQLGTTPLKMTTIVLMAQRVRLRITGPSRWDE